MEKFKQDIITYVYKWGALLLWIFIGFMGSLSHDIITGRPITRKYAIASFGMAFFIGFLTSALCIRFDKPTWSMFLVPFVSLLSKEIVAAMFTLNVRRMLNDWLKYWVDKTK